MGIEEKQLGNNWTEVYANNEELKTTLMRHLMSDVEMALAEQNGTGFVYSMNGIKIWITDKIADGLLKMAYEKLKYIEIISTKLIESLGDITTEYSSFLNTPLTEHQLSVRTLNGLRANGCEIMLDVAKLGWKGVSRIRGLGDKSLEEVRKVFIRQGCIELFDERKSHE
jgi:hypothetical protein